LTLRSLGEPKSFLAKPSMNWSDGREENARRGPQRVCTITQKREGSLIAYHESRHKLWMDRR
jgi:hypothetical protein